METNIESPFFGSSNNELQTFFSFINDDELNESFIEEKLLTDIRVDNYKRYNDIDMSQLEKLSPDYDEIKKEIKRVYDSILPEDLLINDISKSHENKKIIDLIYKYLNQIQKQIEEDLILLEKENNQRQNKIKEINYSNIDNETLQKILNIYNNIIIYNIKTNDNVFDKYQQQLKLKKELNKIYRFINLEVEESTKQEKENINEKINGEIKKINNFVQYLEDLMVEGSIYANEFCQFKDYFNKIIAYDDNNYSDLNRVYNMLCEKLKIEQKLTYFEEVFINERENSKKEEDFIYEKYGIKNIRTSLDYVSSNYIDKLTYEEKEIIKKLYDEINSESYSVSRLYDSFKKIVNKIWKESITDVYSYVEKEDFCFICSNNQFIDEKYSTILITKRMLERVNDYSEYQIGFICDFNDNILYVTENNDIMTINYNDMSNLKSPKQIEQEFINFKVSNRIALNGYITKLEAVYFINDGDVIKYKKAVELANQYSLPLIVLKKDKN